MTDVALRLFRMGHLPVLGEWLALPFIEHAGAKKIGEAISTFAHLDSSLNSGGLNRRQNTIDHCGKLDAGLAEATLIMVARVAHEMATSGRYPQMTIFWDKCQQLTSEEPIEEKEEKRPQRRSHSGGFVFLPPKESADAA